MNDFLNPYYLIEQEKQRQKEAAEKKKALQRIKRFIKQSEQEEIQIKQLINELQIQSATINHCSEQIEYFKKRLALQITPKNELKYKERIYQLEQKKRKAISQSELIEIKLNRI